MLKLGVLQVRDLNMCLRSLDFSLMLSKEIGDTGQDVDILGEIADVYTELGDLEKAGKVGLLACRLVQYSISVATVCIIPPQQSTRQPSISTSI